MAMSRRLAPGVALFLSAALAACDPPDRNDEQEKATTKRSALTTSLFETSVSYPTGSWPEAVAIGDLDGDGRNDVAVITSVAPRSDPANDNMVHVFLQDTDGSLRPRIKYPVGGQSNSIDVGDVNGDGRADVVVGVHYFPADYVGVLLQNATGTLDAMVSYPTSSPLQVKIGDFNGDGRMDVASLSQLVNQTGFALAVMLQTETGTLASSVSYTVPGGGGDPELDAGDVDGDGRTDAVVMHGKVSVLLQNSGGTLGAATSYSLSGVGFRGVAIGDSNGDGRSDLVVSYGGNKPASFIGRFLQNAGGTFSPLVSYPSYDIPTSIVLADVDGDGRKDAVLVHDGWERLGVYRQYPSGDFLSEELYPIPQASSYERQGLAVGDINSDGRPDAVIADYNHGLVVLRHVSETALALAVTAPAAGGSYYATQPRTIRWTTGDTIALASFDVSVGYSSSGVYTYTPVDGCTGLPPTATECSWTPATASGQPVRIRVTARDAQGQTAFAETSFTLITPSISVSAPSAPLLVGKTTTIAWSHNLPTNDTVRVELTRDDGASYETLATAVPISLPTKATAGQFSWTVTGPATTTARWRVTPNGFQPAPAGNSSPSFAITATPTLTFFGPTPGAIYYTNYAFVSWSSNAGNVGTVTVELSRDGGATFETVAASIPNTGNWTGSVGGPNTDNARYRITVAFPGFPTPVSTVSTTFKLVIPELTVTSPAAGSTLFPGTSAAITWASNALPASWTTRVELSRNGGTTWELLGSVFNSGTFNWVVAGAVTSAAQVRVTASAGAVATGTSGTFAIAAPSATVTSPGAGAAVLAGTPVAITWSSNLPASATAIVELSRDGGSTYEVLATGVPNTGSFDWGATGAATSAAIARVTISGPGASVVATSGAFSIVAPSVTVTGPGAGSAFLAGTPVAITWSSNMPASATAVVELSRDGGSTYEVLATGAPNTGSFGWIAMGPGTGAAVARVTVSGPGSASATSGAFGIVEPSLNVTGPAAGAAVYAGAPVAITWSTNMPASSPVLVELSRDGGLTFETLAAAAPNTGRFDWVATGPDSGAVIARVTMMDPVSLTSTSGAFAIATAALTVTGPSAGTLAWAGTPVTITWTHNVPAGDPVSIELSRDGGATFEVLAAVAANTGSYVWTASGPGAAEARVRVTSLGAVSASGVGPAFQIAAATLAVTSPTAGASWAIGTARTISWTGNLPAGTTVGVALSRDGGATWTSLASAAPASGSLAWTATGPATSAAIVRVTANGSVPAVAMSGTFAIGNPAVAVTSPAAGASWTVGTTQTITWSSNLLPSATVKIQLSRNGGSTYSNLNTTAPNTGSFTWTVTGGATTTAIVKVTANGFTASAVSGTFTIAAASVTVTAPNTAVTWTIGTVQSITWNHNVGAGAQFTIEVSRSGTWSVINSAVTAGGATSGSYSWTVTGPKTTNAKVRVTWNGGTAKDTSDVAFKIN